MRSGKPDQGVWRSRGIIFLGWAVILSVVVAATALYERRKLLAEFQSEATVLHRLASQRADQHDAHLTSLSALAIADGTGRRDLLLEVASTITRFYPRIEAVDLVPLQPSAPYLTTRAGLSEQQLAVIRAAAGASDGQLALRLAPGAPESYLLIKRSPNSDDARFGIALEVNAAALLDTDSAIWTRPSVTYALLMPDGTLLTGEGRTAGMRFEKALGSNSQPLLFQADIAPGLSDLLPGGRLAAFAILASLLYAISVLGLRQLARARRAERMAHLSAQEARLAHASRVNTLGEMASGMAHELTQPLTAILSQAQAGRHLSRRGDADAVETVLQSIAEQARRAAAIIERLRNWTRPAAETDRQCCVAEAVRNVEALLRPEADRAGIALSIDLDAGAMPVRGDQVELEQIIFNLVRNAMDAVATAADRRVKVTGRCEGAFVTIDVSDSGPGVPSDLRARLFEPFVTGKPGGTGLGLALCRRFAERMDGELALLADRSGTVFRLRLPLAEADMREAAE